MCCLWGVISERTRAGEARRIRLTPTRAKRRLEWGTGLNEAEGDDARSLDSGAVCIRALARNDSSRQNAGEGRPRHQILALL